jgi:hypothetical protein
MADDAGRSDPKQALAALTNLIGRLPTLLVMGLLAAAVLFGWALSSMQHVPAPFRFVPTALFLLAVVVFVIALSYRVGEYRNASFQGGLIGLAAGALSAILGGAAYWAFNAQGCPVHQPETKLLRLLALVPLPCLMLGLLAGALPRPGQGPKGAAPDAAAGPDDGEAVVRASLSLLFLIGVFGVCAFLVAVANGRLRAAEYAGTALGELWGPDQGDMVMWQMLLIGACFAAIFSGLARVWLGWGGERPEGRPPWTDALQSATTVVLWAILPWLLLFFAMGRRSFGALAERPDTCSALWAGPVTPQQVWLNILLVFVWVAALYAIGVSGSRWPWARWLRWLR